MCRPSNKQVTFSLEVSSKEVKSSKCTNLATTSVLVVLMLVLAGPMLISEFMGGWTCQYTSRPLFSLEEIPDLTNQVAVVTGANTGIGFHTALELARKNATVILTARSTSKGEAALEKIKSELSSDSYVPDVHLLQLDLASLASVEQFALQFQQLQLPLHMLILNAGVMKSPGAEYVGQSMTYGFDTTVDGLEYHIGVNHVAHAYLTQLLLEKLKESAPSRVVVVSSMAEENAYESGMVFDEWTPRGAEMPANYEDGKAYGQSKLANHMWAAELAHRMNGTGVAAYALHPGVIQTEIFRYMEAKMKPQQSAFDRMAGKYFQMALMNSKVGAFTQLHLATAPAEKLVNGGFYAPIGRLKSSSHSQGSNQTLQTILWEETDRVISTLRA